MKFIHPIFAIIFTLAFVQPTEAKELQIFRTDNNYTCIPIDESLSIEHSSATQPEMTISHLNYYGRPQSINLPVSIIDSCAVGETLVPTLYFTFPDFPDAEWVWDREEYISARLDILGAGEVESMKNLTLTVKGRGNTSWSFDKKPMRLKFAKKTSICGFKKAKSYVLLADYLDPSKMRNVIGQWMARKLNMEYANHTQPCIVYVNGRYAGLYLLTEKIGINSGSVDIDENSGILLEMSTEYDEKYKFLSPIYNLPMMVKDPDFDELYEADLSGITPEERLAIWEKDFNLAERTAAYTWRGFDYFDLESTVNYLLINNVLCNSEIGFPKSVYLYKETPEAKYKFGPVWDLDVSCNFLRGADNAKVAEYSSPYDLVYDPTQELWCSKLLKELSNYPVFKDAYKARFEEFDRDIFPQLLDFIDEYSKIIESPAKLDGVKWPGEYIDTWYSRVNSFDRQRQVTLLKSWLISRMDALRLRASSGEL